MQERGIETMDIALVNPVWKSFRQVRYQSFHNEPSASTALME
jgi:hypothetical protein